MDFFFEQFRFRKKTDVNVKQLFWLFYIDLFLIFLLIPFYSFGKSSE